MGEADDAAGDLRAAGLLLALYTLQGIPMGLSGAVPLLLAGRASYAEQALLSLASLPFSLKLLWAPLVDAAYVRRWGRRKTWLVPTQLLIGATMLLSRGRVDAWVAAAAPPVPRIAAYFAALYALWTRSEEGACEPLLEVFALEERGAVLERLRRGRDKFARAVFRKLCRRLRRGRRRRL